MWRPQTLAKMLVSKRSSGSQGKKAFQPWTCMYLTFMSLVPKLAPPSLGINTILKSKSKMAAILLNTSLKYWYPIKTSGNMS